MPPNFSQLPAPHGHRYAEYRIDMLNSDHLPRPIAVEDRSGAAEARQFPQSTARAWAQVLAPYRQPSNGRGIVEIAITIVPLFALWVLMWATLDLGYWLALRLRYQRRDF